jgi:hypothetical protein
MLKFLHKKEKMMFDRIVDFLVILHESLFVYFSLCIKKMSSIVYKT